MKKEYEPAPAGKRYIFRPWKTVDGKRVNASQYGLRVFVFLVDA